MYDSVRQNFQKFSSKFEGYVPWMYLDVKGLVTTGMGNLIDSVADAQKLPWYKPDGSLASPNEVGAEWSLVKGMQDKKNIGGGNFGPLTTLRLHDDGIQQLINSKLDANEAILIKRFPGYSSWPADAQLGLLSMAWAMGPAFNFPKFQSAVNQLVPDFKTAAVESHMNDVGNPGLTPRNAANLGLFNNAQYVLDNNLPHDVLQWAEGLIDSAVTSVSAAASSAADTVSSATGAVAKAPTNLKVMAGIFLLLGGIGGTIYLTKKGR